MPALSSSPTSLILLAVAFCASGAAVTVRAQEGPQMGDVRSGPDMRASWGRQNVGPRGAQDSMSDSVRRIERTTRGRVLSVERMHADGRDVNRVKVMDDSGRVRVYVDDPQQRGRAARARGDDD
ncbi:hypothetical protein [Luteimonas sp. TWI1416]|uniref:PepSY domain-containing protein n=1 Tax=unclassified Luteimonas TaxID=2629088 RepID=UPI003207F20D